MRRSDPHATTEGPPSGRGSPGRRTGLLPPRLARVLAFTLALTLPATGGIGATGAFPRVVIDDEGTAVTIPAEPRRIISLTPGSTEILFALGAGPRVVATTDADDYPPEAVPLPDVASFGTVDLERVVAAEADLVVAGGNGYSPPDAITAMRSLGLPVVVTYAPSVEGVLADIELLGRAVGREDEAALLTASMRSEIESLAHLVRDRPHPRVFYEIDASGAIYGPSDDSFLAEMVALAGGTPITSGSGMSFEVPLERLIAEDPEVIILGDAAYGTTPEDVAARPGWGTMTAVRSGAIRPADDTLITRPGPRLAEGLRDLIAAIHPDVLR